MNNESIRNLRLDRRLHARRDWIEEKELQAALDALPDVADKIMPAGEDEPVAEQAQAATSPAAESAGSPESGLPPLPEGSGV